MVWMVQYALPLFIVLIGLESNSLNMIGAVSALLMAYIILLTQSVYWFLILLIFLFISMLATRYKEDKKENAFGLISLFVLSALIRSNISGLDKRGTAIFLYEE